MNTRVYVSGKLGEHITTAAQRAVNAAPSRLSFNDICIDVDHGMSAGDVAAEYARRCDERAAAWAASPEGSVAAERARLEQSVRQAKMDDMMRELSAVDLRNVSVALDWMVRAEDPLGHVDTRADRERIVTAFEAAGYRIGENVGAAFREDCRENVAKYIIGQALDGIVRVGAPHPVIHVFAERWRERFEPTPPNPPARKAPPP